MVPEARPQPCSSTSGCGIIGCASGSEGLIAGTASSLTSNPALSLEEDRDGNHYQPHQAESLQHTIIQYDLLWLARSAGVDLERVLQESQGERCDRDRGPRDAECAVATVLEGPEAV